MAKRSHPLWWMAGLGSMWLVVHGAGRSQQASADVVSTLQIIAVDGKEQAPTPVYTAHTYFEAPNWKRDGSGLLFDQGGRVFEVGLAGGTPRNVDVGAGMRCNGSHGFSPDGKLLAVTCTTPQLAQARVYLAPAVGGTARVLTGNPNSYFHSWSPDGKTVLFTRPDHGSLNILAIDVSGGEERPLTTGAGVSDDPDYSGDGRWVYFNSDRSGSMQIWRMHPDGSGAEQMTFDTLVNWTPHPSPDGRWVVFLSYEAGVTGHPANKPVSLRLMSVADRKVRVLTKLVGGSGTINVPSWSPDSRRLAFVSFEVQPNGAP